MSPKLDPTSSALAGLRNGTLCNGILGLIVFACGTPIGIKAFRRSST
jgi:hypothetical protein